MNALTCHQSFFSLLLDLSPCALAAGALAAGVSVLDVELDLFLSSHADISALSGG